VKALLDASVLLALVTPEPATEEACSVFRSATERLSLDFALVEASNALWRKHRQGLLDRDALAAAHRSVCIAPDTLIPSYDLTEPALSLALTLDHPVYDCLYAIAAERAAATLVTADKRFAAKLVGQDISVQLIP
jgi:predicted nucleic acid-binding protein